MASNSGSPAQPKKTPLQSKAVSERQLTADEQEKLDSDRTVVSEFKQQKLEKEAQKNWDLFYKRNTTKFFKDRHWTTREFEDLCGERVDGQMLRLLEVGCGVGNFLFPLIEDVSNIFIYACDFSPRAVNFVKENPLYKPDHCKAFHCDLTRDALTTDVPPDGVDIVTMIFVLSAIHPDKVVAALQNVYTVLRPGGCVLLRDYGLYDHAQLRFSSGHKLQENFYVRQDGTRAFYFPKDHLARLFKEAGFKMAVNEYVLRETVNKKEQLCVPRVFVQSKFVKPINTDEVNSDIVDSQACCPTSGSAERQTCPWAVARPVNSELSPDGDQSETAQVHRPITPDFSRRHTVPITEGPINVHNSNTS